MRDGEVGAPRVDTRVAIMVPHRCGDVQLRTCRLRVTASEMSNNLDRKCLGGQTGLGRSFRRSTEIRPPTLQR